MSSRTNHTDKRILVVARWPLGGIRTYMRYMFRHFPAHYKLTLLAASTQENAAIQKDAAEYGARLLLVQSENIGKFAFSIFNELRGNDYDIILSQGFISAVSVYMANFIFRVPHVLTIHGILEPKYLDGRFAGLKRRLLGKILKEVTVLYGVSNDILNHLYEQFPDLAHNGPIAIMIPNGIEPLEFETVPATYIDLRNNLNVDVSTFLFGFFGRFMYTKGFDLLIEAVNVLAHQNDIRPFSVLAVGSGDYIRELQQQISNLGLEPYFYFLPFQPQVYQRFPQVDAIVMPSRCEASGLLAMESLCMGTPLIASDCMGLRETISATPAMIFTSEDVAKLADVMRTCMVDNKADDFKSFIPSARKRYDVFNSSQQLVQLIESIT